MCAFVTLPADYVEEANLHAKLASRKPVRQSYGNMQERSATCLTLSGGAIERAMS